MAIRRTTWLWSLLVTLAFLGWADVAPARSAGKMPARVSASHSVRPGNPVPPARIASTPRVKKAIPARGKSATLSAYKGDRLNALTPLTGSGDDGYVNYRLAQHALRSATVLIVRLPSDIPHLRLSHSANPSSPRAPPLSAYVAG